MYPTSKETPREVTATTRVDVTYLTETERKIHAIGDEVVDMRQRGFTCVSVMADPDQPALAAKTVVAVRNSLGAGGVPLMVPVMPGAGLAGALLGVLIEATPQGALGRVAVAGVLPPELSGLSPGSAFQPVRANPATSLPERITSIAGDDLLVGHATADGQLALTPLILTPSRWQAHANPANGVAFTYQVEGNTADATPTSLASFTPGAGVASIADVVVTGLGIKSDGAAHYKQDVEACFRCTAGGVVTEMGVNTPSTAKTNGTTVGMGIAIDTSGGAIRAVVTGRAAETWRWTLNVTITYRTAAAA